MEQAELDMTNADGTLNKDETVILFIFQNPWFDWILVKESDKQRNPNCKLCIAGTGRHAEALERDGGRISCSERDAGQGRVADGFHARFIFLVYYYYFF